LLILLHLCLEVPLLYSSLLQGHKAFHRTNWRILPHSSHFFCMGWERHILRAPMVLRLAHGSRLFFILNHSAPLIYGGKLVFSQVKILMCRETERKRSPSCVVPPTSSLP
jgi:hypothetical protein